jgi:hypothetical protein
MDLWAAAQQGDVGKVRDCLGYHRAVKCRARLNRALFVACCNDWPDVVCLLLGAKGDAADASGVAYTPLRAAVKYGSCAVLSLFTQTTALPEWNTELRLVAAAAQHEQEDALRLLVTAKVCVDARFTDGCAAVVSATARGDARAVRMLVGAKCDVDVTNAYTGQTPCSIAAEKGDVRTLCLLLAAKCDVGKATSKGCTPYHYAAFEASLGVRTAGRPERYANVLRLLLEAKAAADILQDTAELQPAPIFAVLYHQDLLERLAK